METTPFEHGISHLQLEELNGYTKCLRDFHALIGRLTEYNPDKRFIDSLVLLDKIAATNKKNMDLLLKSTQELDELKVNILSGAKHQNQNEQ